MGIFYVDCDVTNVNRPAKRVTVSKLLVDSGSECTWIPQDLLRKLGVKVFKKDESFLMANGETVTRQVGYAILSTGEFKTVDEIVFAQPGDLNLLGARTLEGFGAVVDSRKKKLVAGGPRPAAPAHVRLKAKLEQAEAAVENGDVLSHEQVVKQTEQWFAESKNLTEDFNHTRSDFPDGNRNCPQETRSEGL